MVILSGLAATFLIVVLRPWMKLAGDGWQSALALIAVSGFWATTLLVFYRNHRARSARESDERLHMVLDGAPIAMLITRISDGTILFANSHAAAFFGKPVAELTGGTITEYYHEPQLRELMRAEMMEKGHVIDFEIRFKKGDGTLAWVSASQRLVTLSGEQVGIGGFVDMTERRLAEKKLAQSRQRKALILDAIEEGVIFVDIKAAVLNINPAGARILQWEPNEVAAHQLNDILSHEHLDGLHHVWESCPIQTTLEKGIIQRSRGFHFIRKNGEKFPVEYVALPVREDGEIVGAVLTFKDMTQQQQTAEERQRMYADLECRVVERTDELAQLNEDLRSARDELERRVAERTGELMVMNQILQDEVRERLHAEELRRIERDKAQSYLDIAGTIFLALDADGCVTLINRAGCRLLGYEEQDIIGKRWSNHFLPPDVRQWMEPLHAQIIRGETELARSTEYGVVTRDGGQRIVRWHNTEIRDGQAIVGVLSSGEDVTEQRSASEELRESEERYRMVVDNVGIGVALISPQMQILSLNRQMRDWNPTLDVATHPICYRAFNNPPRDCVCSYCPTQLTLKDGLVHESTTETPMGDDVVNYRIVATPICNSAGEIVAAIEMVEDVTQRFRTEREQRQHTADLARSKQETEEALAKLKLAQASMVHSEKMASIGVLAAGIAHEINNPIGFVSNNLRELIHYTDKIQSYLKRMGALEESVVRGDTESAVLIQKDLDALKASLKWDFVLDDLNSIVRESLEGTASVEATVQALKAYARRDDESMSSLSVIDCIDNSLRVVMNQIRFKVDVIKDYSPVPYINGHSGALQQVFSNLLINAAQAVEGHGTVALSVGLQEDLVTVCVTDSGSGIKPEHLPRIFEPFFTTKDVGQGTGLGLSIVYDIVKKHHGDISVESVPGKGTSFTLRFPAITNTAPLSHGDIQ